MLPLIDHPPTTEESIDDSKRERISARESRQRARDNWWREYLSARERRNEHPGVERNLQTDSCRAIENAFDIVSPR